MTREDLIAALGGQVFDFLSGLAAPSTEADEDFVRGLQYPPAPSRRRRPGDLYRLAQLLVRPGVQTALAALDQTLTAEDRLALYRGLRALGKALADLRGASPDLLPVRLAGLLSGGITGPQGPAGPAGPAGADGAAAAVFSPLAFWGQSVGAAAGDYSVGIYFATAASDKQCSGVTFVYPDSTSRTVRIRLWNMDTTTTLAVATATYATAGTKSLPFAAAISLTPGVRYAATVYFTAGTQYVRADGGALPLEPATGFVVGDIVYSLPNAYAAGDAVPGSTGTERYAVQPTF